MVYSPKRPEHTERSAAFLNAWPRFQELAEALRQAVIEEVTLPCWVWRYGYGFTARVPAAEIYTQHFFQDEQDPKETVILPGLLGASDETRRVAHALNAARNQVQEALSAMDRIQVGMTNPVTGRTRKERLGDLVLRDAGLARLHRVQVYREVHVLERRPDNVSFVWARTRRVKRLSIEAVRQRLQRLLDNPPQAELVREDLARLGSLPRNEELALIDPMPCHARVNLAWRRQGETQGFDRAMRSAPIPLLYPAAADDELPSLKPLDPQRGALRQRAKRSDVKIEDQPFLATLAVYRYRAARSNA